MSNQERIPFCEQEETISQALISEVAAYSQKLHVKFSSILYGILSSFFTLKYSTKKFRSPFNQKLNGLVEKLLFIKIIFSLRIQCKKKRIIPMFKIATNITETIYSF
ncbi:hypothetical protein ABPG72_019525 [Tetrahymena utriculariae]